MSILKASRIKLSYKFLHTITIFVSILHSLHGFPTDVSSIPDNNYGLPYPLTDTEEFGWKLGVCILLVILGGIFAGTFNYFILYLDYKIFA
jgi:hypothetical protein